MIHFGDALESGREAANDSKSFFSYFVSFDERAWTLAGNVFQSFSLNEFRVGILRFKRNDVYKMKFQWNFRWAFLWLQTGEVEVMACWLERLLAFLVIINDSRFVIVSHTINLQTPTNWSAIESLLITTFGSTSQANDDSHFERTKLRVTKLFMNFTREIRWLTVFFFISAACILRQRTATAKTKTNAVNTNDSYTIII